MNDKGQDKAPPTSGRRGTTSPPRKAGRRSAASKSWRTHAPLARAQARDPVSLRWDRAAADAGGLSFSQLDEIYRYLLLTRRLEEHLVALKRQGMVVGGVYRSLGQEATAVGCAYAMHPGDYVQPLIRDLGAALVHGLEPIAVLRQYMARGTGPSAGRDLNVHVSCPERGLIGPVSTLGTCIPVVAGALLAARLKGEGKAGLAFIGDGGSSTGAFYEGLNFAAVQRLPLILVIEANGYAFSTPTHCQVPEGDLLARARGFGVAVSECDGNDVLACHGATAEARKRGLAGKGPTVILAHTYRRLGHTDHDAGGYAGKGEAESWAKQNDPLTRFEKHLASGKHLNAKQLRGAKEDVEDALEFARSTVALEPIPDLATVAHGVFAEDPPAPFPAVDAWFGPGARFRTSIDPKRPLTDAQTRPFDA